MSGRRERLTDYFRELADMLETGEMDPPNDKEVAEWRTTYEAELLRVLWGK
jgi:uncharacterized protein YecA (UPF0149 family)